MTEPAKHVWPCLNYADAPAAICFLTDLGFVDVLTVPGEGDGLVAHAELLWPEGGGVMLGSAGRGEGEFSARPIGAGSMYAVTDDPHGVMSRAQAAGATVVREMREEDFGSTGFTVADPEGNLWSFGTYRGEPLPSAD